MSITDTFEGSTPTPVRQIGIGWTSNASGAATVELGRIEGIPISVKFVHGEGDDAPTNLYDVTITDPDGIDILLGLGANLATASNSKVAMVDADSSMPLAVNDVLTLNITNAGDTKSGTVYLYLR